MKHHSCSVLILLSLLTAVIALYSWPLRRDMFNSLAPGHEWLTASTVIFSRNWYCEGPFALHFLQLWNPSSIEFPDIISRQPYVSAPSGTILPIYLISRLLHTEPSVAMVQGYALLNHCLITLTLALTVYFALRRNNFSVFGCLLLAAATLVSFLLFPVNMYGFQNIFYSDQAVVLPYVLLILLELVRSDTHSFQIRVAQACVIFWGCYTDWFFWCAALILYLLRLSLFNQRWTLRLFVAHTVEFWLPALCALAIFFMQIIVHDLASSFFHRISVHSGARENRVVSWSDFLHTWWGMHVTKFYGSFSLPLFVWAFVSALGLLSSALVARIGQLRLANATHDAILLLSVAALPPIIYTHALPNYAYPHDFSAHKLSVTAALVIFAVVPLLGKSLLDTVCCNERQPRHVALYTLMTELCLALPFLIIACVASLHRQDMWRYRPAHLGARTFNPFKELGEFIRRTARYDDIVISPHFQIGSRPPHFLAYSHKRVYLTPTPFDAQSKLVSCGSNALSVILLVGTNSPGDFSSLLPKCHAIYHGPHCTAYRLHRSDIQFLVHRKYPTMYNHMMALHNELSATSGYRIVYASNLRSITASNFLVGRYGLINWGHTGVGENLHLWGFDCRRALVAHAPPKGVGEVRIPLRPEYALFRTILAVNHPYGQVSYGIHLDGHQVLSSGPLSGASLPVFVEIHVRGHHELVLTLDPCGSHAGDEAVWIDPHFLIPLR